MGFAKAVGGNPLASAARLREERRRDDIGRCPGQDRINWTADDIFDVLCPSCGQPIEYFKDDQRRKCPGCGAVVENPRFDNGCAEWCAAAENCSIMRGVLVEDEGD